MNTPLVWIVWPLLGFLAGSIPFGYLVARARGVDIRSVGSGNIGMTNVWRSLGWKPGATVLVLDLLKGILPVMAVHEWWKLVWPRIWPALMEQGKIPVCMFPYTSPDAWHEPQWVMYLALLTGAAAVFGHSLTPWLGFKGGKGIATGAGVFIALMELWALVPVGAFLLGLAVTRMVSVGSLLGAYSGLITTLAVPQLRWLSPVVLLLAGFVTWTHRDNIVRIRNGTERRIGTPRSPAAEEQHPPAGTG